MKRGRLFKKRFAVALALTGIVFAAAGCSDSAAGGDDNTLVVFNYGDYIDRDTIQMFEEETGIEVKYEGIHHTRRYVYQISVRCD